VLWWRPLGSLVRLSMHTMASPGPGLATALRSRGTNAAIAEGRRTAPRSPVGNVRQALNVFARAAEHFLSWLVDALVVGSQRAVGRPTVRRAQLPASRGRRRTEPLSGRNDAA